MTVSEQIKQAYRDGSHKKVLKVYFPNLDLEVPEENVYFEDFSLEESIMESETFEAIGCISSKMEVSIRDVDESIKGESIHISIGIDDIQNSDIDLFDGIVDEAKLEANSKKLNIVAYDALYGISDADVADWYNDFEFPDTLSEITESLLDYLDIDYDTFTLPNGDVEIDKEFTPTILNALTVLKSICQINGVFGMMNRVGKFEFRSLSNTSESIPFYKEIEYQSFTTSAISRVTIRQNDKEIGIHYGSGSNNYIIQGNMFSYGLTDETLRDVAQNIYSVVSGISYIPFEVENYGFPWLECGLNSKLSYSVYDFDASQQQEQDVYVPKTFTFFKRELTGIQNLWDKYTATGEKDQKVFITDLGSQLDMIQQELEDLKENTSSDIVTYRNSKTINVPEEIEDDPNSEGTTVCNLTYTSRNGGISVFHQELVVDSAYEGTCDVEYYLNGNKLVNHITKETLVEGVNLLHLMQFWKNGNKETYKFQVKIKPYDTYLTVSPNMSSAYIILREGEPNEYDFYIEQEPYVTDYPLGAPLNYDGLIVKLAPYDGSTPIDVTESCTITPPEGTIYTQTTTVLCHVKYTHINEAGEKTKYEDSFYCYVDDDWPDDPLQYVNYHTDDVNRLVYLDGLKTMDIAEDQPATIVIPKYVAINGAMYECVIN